MSVGVAWRRVNTCGACVKSVLRVYTLVLLTVCIFASLGTSGSPT